MRRAATVSKVGVRYFCMENDFRSRWEELRRDTDVLQDFMEGKIPRVDREQLESIRSKTQECVLMHREMMAKVPTEDWVTKMKEPMAQMEGICEQVSHLLLSNQFSYISKDHQGNNVYDDGEVKDFKSQLKN